jgi:hypothetical protein
MCPGCQLCSILWYTSIPMPEDLSNPTAPPTVPGTIGSEDSRVVFPPPSFGSIFATAFQVLRQNYWPITGVAVGSVLLSWLITMPIGWLAMKASANTAAGDLVEVAAEFFVHMLISTPLWAGTTYWACRRARSLPTNLTMVFFGFKHFGRILPFAALTAGVYSLAGFTSALLSLLNLPNAAIFSGVASLLCLVGVVWFTLTYGFTTVVQLDHEWRAPLFDRGMELSSRLTRGHRLTLLWLFVVVSFIVFLSALLLLLPLIFFGLPFVLAGYGAAYAVLAQPMLKPSECRACGYDLRTVVGNKCPECGTPKELCSSCSADLSAVQSPTCPSCGRHRAGPVLRLVCIKCKYNLEGINAPVCPECGTPRQTNAI